MKNYIHSEILWMEPISQKFTTNYVLFLRISVENIKEK